MSINHPFRLLVTAASDSAVSCERLLRAALVIAKAVDDKVFSTWCESELSGYFNTKVSELPDYRWITGVVMVKDRWGQVSPGLFQSTEHQQQLSRSQVAEPIGQVEKNANVAEGSEFSVQYPPELGERLRKAFGGALDVFRVVQRLGFQNVVTHVRQKTFMWAVDGINREVIPGLETTIASMLGIAHSEPLRQAPHPVQMDSQTAGGITLYNSNLLLNSAGASATIIHHQGVDRAALLDLVAELRKVVDGVTQANRPAELVAALAELSELSGMNSPRQSFVKEALSSLRSVLEGGAGAVIGELAKPHILALISNVLK